ncbi:threonine aldolase family protein [Chloroflexota bacterium]
MDKKETDRILAGCDRFLHGHYRHRLSPAESFEEILAKIDRDWQSDHYGQGDVISNFEKQMAEMLGKPAAVFMPSGTMCQQIALRIWSERKGSKNIGFHPKCHLEIHEQKGYQVLHSLNGVLIGQPDRLITMDDLGSVRDPLAALLLELPQREIGGQLPSWDELCAMTVWARKRGMAVHMDGARLWEIGPSYQRSYAEIAAVFDTVYVSFYKGLAGLAGAILAGPQDFIDEARIWQRRHGGNLIRLYPYILSAKIGLETHLPRMAEFHTRAVEIALRLSAIPEIEVTPDPPHAHMMHLYLRGDKERLVQAALALAEESKVWLFSSLGSSPMANYHMLELSVGDATLDLSVDEVGDLFAELFRRSS